MKSSPSQVSSRLRRAQHLRQQRLKARGITNNSNEEEEEETLVLSGACTVICALLIVAMGAGLATLFFIIYQPDCVKDWTAFQQVESKHDQTKDDRRMKKNEAFLSQQHQETGKSVPAAATAAATMPLSSTFPPQCTSDQMEVLKRQLPPGGCEKRKDKPFRRMDCSFSAATTCGDYPVWLYDFHAHHNVVLDDDKAERFQAIMVGCNKAYDAVDLLRLATRDTTERYDREAWRAQFLKTDDPLDPIDDAVSSCPRKLIEIPTTQQPQEAQVYCIEAAPNTFQQLEKTKDAMGYTIDELDLSHIAMRLESGTMSVYTKDPIGISQVGPANWRHKCVKFSEDCVEVPADKIDNWIQSKPNLNGEETPIHYLSVTVDDNAYEVLQGAAKTLRRVQYLDLTYHWFGDWGTSDRSLNDLITRLKKKGHICYFHGDDDNLWRITDCWQEHYELHFFANIACVNVQLPAAQPLAQKMENAFLATLKKPYLHYGEA
ncbi:hypothetical protein IV203_006919 [Nitzschia inconspicua]|uniref:Methyltransferase domain-containing protein n=1 Tax=Nitzschia inconspicua TaxID=303405 RepID=A0A9K3KE59_9STRA|nr:hypothetical protein IV203_006919 [Nitzschia inconspicua]